MTFLLLGLLTWVCLSIPAAAVIGMTIHGPSTARSARQPAQLRPVHSGESALA